MKLTMKKIGWAFLLLTFVSFRQASSNVVCDGVPCWDGHICSTIIKDKTVSENCIKEEGMRKVCNVSFKCLNLQQSSCRLIRGYQDLGSDILTCMDDEEYDEMVKKVSKPKELEDSLPWCIVIAILSLLPLLVLTYIVFYRIAYKMPRIGREKEDLRQLFNSFGYDEDSPLFRDVFDFFYE